MSVRVNSYLFFHMRHGIFVMIRENRVVMFVPFVNKDYVNLWGESLQVQYRYLVGVLRDGVTLPGLSTSQQASYHVAVHVLCGHAD